MIHFEALSRRFLSFAQTECDGSSPLYAYLARKVAEDKELLALSSKAQMGQPIPNLFFGSVHYLLLSQGSSELEKYYESVTFNPLPLEHAYPEFRKFCFEYSDQIEHLLQTKLVQTNEVRRCGYLYPSFSFIHKIAKRPLALMEIGTSAGVQLLWDTYAYSYGDGQLYGAKEAKVQINSEIKGSQQPPFATELPLIGERYGFDLHTIDITSEEEQLWLKALIWPEHHERRKLFQQAATHFKPELVRFLEGNGVELLTEYAQRIPSNQAICIFHTHVANQMPEEVKKRLLEVVREIGQTRDVFHLYNNISDKFLHLDYVVNGEYREQIIAETDGHGRWFKWLAAR